MLCRSVDWSSGLNPAIYPFALLAIRNKLYYGIKPLIPRSLRLGLRSWVTLQKRELVGHIWPILRGSETAPKDWPGWPDGKEFALVLTHDVETEQGVCNCKLLMRLEADLGFRSSYNFIPEGDYRVSKQLRDELTSKGFEVGVHDLYHDGKLYSSRAGFAEKARRINDYLRDWGAVGFRSGFMLHNLEWLSDLNTLYDSSTFDTDPFEPQPDGVGTIFPFWVPRISHNGEQNDSGINNGKSEQRLSGYVELPYTLPQDSTVFLLLRERHPDIWFQKLDWIARHGGMALLNVHPDYACFDNSAGRGEFPVSRYTDLLNYVRARYPGKFWQALPREVAAYVSELNSKGERKSAAPKS